MTTREPAPFRYDGEVKPGEKRHIRYEIGETYLGDPVEMPVTIVNGEHGGPTLCLTAAVHGDELNGVKVLQEVADAYDPGQLHGTLVCLHVVNVPGYLAQQRDIPIYDQDLNRSFPGKAASNTAERMAEEIYTTFVSNCDLGIDFHTSTRNRTTMYHTRADMDREAVAELTRAFGANVTLVGAGEPSSLRAVATADGIPTITVEMGKAHRFQRPLIEKAVDGVENVMANYGLLPDRSVRRPKWHQTLGGDQEKRWLRADSGGLVEMEWGPTPLVHEDETICRIRDHFSREEHVVTAPFTGILVGVLENPIALPGHPLCHIARIDPETHREIEAEVETGEFDGYRQLGLRWMGDGEQSE